MRKIVQILVLVSGSILAVNKGHGQLPKVLAFGNFTYGSPSSTDFKNISNYGTGYELGAGFGFGKTMLIGSIGQINYHLPQQSIGGVILFEKEDYKITPIKVGLRRYLLLGLFLNGNLGIAISNSKSHFLYEAGAGYKLGFFEIGAAYTSYKLSSNLNTSAFLFKAGLAIKL
jgi:hypothetical protein